MRIEENISLKDKNWFCTGGNARFFCQPSTAQEFQDALLWAKNHNQAVEMIGEGANVLIADDGFDGLIICPAIISTEVNKEQAHLSIGAGTKIANAINQALDYNLIGLEEFSGIPGTIGGGIYINIHYFQFFLSQFLVEAKIINKETGEIKTVDAEWFQFGYDTSHLQKKEWFLVQATFQLKKATDIETAYAKGRRDEIIRQRNSRYPTSRTCGSFFRNFHPDELVKCTTEKKIPFIGYYLDVLGIKGILQCGDAKISPQHANMIINTAHATSQDIVTLARTMQEQVFDKFNLVPRSECQFIGFKAFPLHTEQSLHTLKSHHVKFSADTQPSIEP